MRPNWPCCVDQEGISRRMGYPDERASKYWQIPQLRLNAGGGEAPHTV